jgi:hypothetical protein
MLEPENLTRRIYGFDTFEGFPSVGQRDRSTFTDAQPGGAYAQTPTMN